MRKSNLERRRARQKKEIKFWYDHVVHYVRDLDKIRDLVGLPEWEPATYDANGEVLTMYWRTGTGATERIIEEIEKLKNK